MNLAVCRLTLRLPENGSLKGRRRVLKSIEQRLHNRFNVSVAEVDHNEAWQLAGIAICCVANRRRTPARWWRRQRPPWRRSASTSRSSTRRRS